MPLCCAYNCSYRHVNKEASGKTVHLFPFSRPDILKQWINNVRRENWYPNRRSIICSDHFEEDCFDRSGQTVRLKGDAVPTKFDLSSNSKKGSKGKKALQGSHSETIKVPEHDHHYCESMSELKQKLEKELEKKENYKKKMKVQQQRIRRLQKSHNKLLKILLHVRSSLPDDFIGPGSE